MWNQLVCRQSSGVSTNCGSSWMQLGDISASPPPGHCQRHASTKIVQPGIASFDFLLSSSLHSPVESHRGPA